METTEKNDRPSSPAWRALLSRAVMALDEEELATYRRRKEDMARKLARNMRECGAGAPPFDFYMVQEVLVEYDRLGRLSEALAKCGGRESECIEAKKHDADIKLVWDFVKERIKERMAVRAADIAQEAQDGLRRLVTDETCKLDSRALKMALEGAAPELYGGGGGGGKDADKEEEERRKRIPASGGIIINVVGDAAAKLIAPKLEGRPGGVFIDV